jgi:hypothetical protein
MSFPLINPTPTFTDSSGSPLSGGSIEFRSPTTNALINSYPTADDSDAGTNANANPLTLNSRGEAASGLYLEDGVAYKITLKDSAGATVWTQDDVLCPIALPYLQTTAESDAGITPTNIEYPPGNVLRYGTNTTPGTTDMATALTNALSVNAVVTLPEEDILLGSAITLADQNGLIGSGPTSDNTTRGATCLVRGFTGSGATIVASGDDCFLTNLDIDNDDQGTGECVKVTGTRFRFTAVSCRKSGGVGVRVGDTEAGASSINANLGRIDYLAVLNNADDGIRFDHTNTSTTGTFPLGVPDCNSWSVNHIDARSNGADGLNIANSIDNTFTNTVAQSNTGYGVHLEDDARGHVFFKPYTEANTGALPSNDGELILDSGADNNVILGSRAGLVSPVWTNNGAGNFILSHNTAIANGEFTLGVSANIQNLAASGKPILRFYADANAGLTSELEAEEVGTSGGQLTIRTKRDGDTPVARMVFDEKGNVVVNNAAIATNATDGFLYVPSCAGTPTGVPTTKTGMVPIVVDSTNNKLYFYVGSWRDAGP